MARTKTEAGKIEEFDRAIAIEQMISAASEAASAGAHLYRLGAIDRDEFDALRVRFKAPGDVPNNLSTKAIRKAAESLRGVVKDFEERYNAANRLLERQAVVSRAPRKTTKARGR